MPANIYLENFLDIYSDAMSRAKIPVTNTTKKNDMKTLINERYSDVSNAMLWKWLVTQGHLDLAAYYNTGTAAVTVGSATVTITTGVVTSAMAGRRFMTVAHGEVYKIASVDTTANILTLGTEWHGATETAGAYYIDQEIHSLASDFDRMVDVQHAFWPYDVEMVDIHRFREIQSSNIKRHDKPSHSCLIGLDSDGVMQIAFYPASDDEAIRLPYDYIKMITPLENDTDEPLIPDKFRHILVEGALADYYRDYLRQESIANTHEARYTSLLDRMAKDWQMKEGILRLLPDIPRFRRRGYVRRPWYEETGINE